MTISKMFHAASAAIAGFSITTTLAVGAAAQANSTPVKNVLVHGAWALAQANTQKEFPQKESPPDVPDSIQAPAGEEDVLYAHATGSQIYNLSGRRGGQVQLDAQSA